MIVPCAPMQPLWMWGGATTETEISWASSMCPNFNLNHSISSETILKRGF